MSSKNFFSLSGRKALITGGTSGLGLALAERFVAAGAQVVIAGRRDGGALAREIGARFIRCDVTDELQQASLFECAQAHFGKLDIVVNNAGFENTGPTIEDASGEALDRIIATNQKGVFYGLKHAPRHMNDGGAIINTASVAGVIGVFGYGQYAMTKAAIVGLTKCAALELAPRGIRVNAVCPGTIRTAMVPDDHPEIPLVEALAPLGRIAPVEDIVGLYHFLAADEGRYLTGQAINIDGGITAGPSLAVCEKVMA